MNFRWLLLFSLLVLITLFILLLIQNSQQTNKTNETNETNETIESFCNGLLDKQFQNASNEGSCSYTHNLHRSENNLSDGNNGIEYNTSTNPGYKSYWGYGKTLDWKLNSGKENGQVSIQDNGTGTISLGTNLPSKNGAKTNVVGGLEVDNLTTNALTVNGQLQYTDQNGNFQSLNNHLNSLQNNFTTIQNQQNELNANKDAVKNAIKINNTTVTEYPSAYKSNDFTAMLYDRNLTQHDTKVFPNTINNYPGMYYWDAQNSEIRYIMDSGNTQSMNANFNKLNATSICISDSITDSSSQQCLTTNDIKQMKTIIDKDNEEKNTTPIKCGAYNFCVNKMNNNRAYCYGSSGGCLWGSNDCTSDKDCQKYDKVTSPKYTDDKACSEKAIQNGGWFGDTCAMKNS